MSKGPDSDKHSGTATTVNYREQSLLEWTLDDNER
jgi:hypothetical protein